MTEQSTKLERITFITVGTVALISFILSYSNIQQLAELNGYGRHLSYLVPLIIDGALLAFAFVLLDVSISHNKQPITIKLLVGLFVAISIWANISHSDISNGIQITFAIIIPLSLAFTFETVMWRIKTRLQANENLMINQLQSEIEQLQLVQTELQTELQLQVRLNEELKSLPRLPENLNQFGMAFIALLQGNATAVELAEMYPGISASWISRTKNRLTIDG